MGIWLTPDGIPDPPATTTLWIPGDPEFEAIMMGALSLLIDPQNFIQHGTLTPEETADYFFEAVSILLNLPGVT